MAEPIARWVTSTNKLLVLNSDGSLLEKGQRGADYKTVSKRTTGVEALMYAARNGYSLVEGSSVPSDFIPEEGTIMAATVRKSKNDPLYDEMRPLIEGGMSALAAAKQVAAGHPFAKENSLYQGYQRKFAGGTARPPKKRTAGGNRDALSVVSTISNSNIEIGRLLAGQWKALQSGKAEIAKAKDRAQSDYDSAIAAIDRDGATLAETEKRIKKLAGEFGIDLS